MPDSHDKIGPDIYVKFPELHFLNVIEVACGTQYDKEVVAVVVKLRALVAGKGVLDGKFMKAKLFGNLMHLLGVRPVKPEPAHSAGFLHGFKG